MSEEGVDNSGFLARWSRRKQKNDPTNTGTDLSDNTVTGAEPDDLPMLADELPAGAHGPVAEPGPESELQDPLLTDEDMPPVETLDSDSDYSPFLSEGVSKELRNIALKKLFFSGKFAVRDGLDDYDDDFTRFEPLGDTITSDMKFHQRRKERERLARIEEEEQQRLSEQDHIDDESTAEEHVNEEGRVDGENPDNQQAEERVPEAEVPLESEKPDDSDQPAKPQVLAGTDQVTSPEKISAGDGKLHRKLPLDNEHPEGKST